MPKRGPWDGMLAIVHFNWPLYAVALLVLVAATAGILAGGIFTWICGLSVLGCLWFLLGSLGVSHWVYDRSDLYRGAWLDRILQGRPQQTFVLCHSGFDEASPMLKVRFASALWTVLDHFDPATMTEASIGRARNRFPPTPETIAATFDRWPLAEDSQDVVLGVLAIHELRTRAGRAAWFREARRCLAVDGCVVLVEHVRDLANFMAFGPGFLHFHAVPAWKTSWEEAGFGLICHFRITPFVRVFVLQPT